MDFDANQSSAPRKPATGKGRLAARFRNINVLLFLLVFCAAAAVMLAAFNDVIRRTSIDYARQYAIGTAEAFSAHIVKEIGLMAKAANSAAVTDWLSDEGDPGKKALAHEELLGTIKQLYSYNLYISFGTTKNEYRIERDGTAEVLEPITSLDESNPDDAWFFECLASHRDYELSVNMDHVLQRKRVWLDYKVVQDGVPLGVICTGLEFSHVAGELFSQYNGDTMRGLIIDEDGVVYIDSTRLSDADFLRNDFETPIESEFSNLNLLAAVNAHLGEIDGYFEEMREPVVIELEDGPHQFMAIAPIRYTDWSAVFLVDPSSLLELSLFVPVSVIMLILLVAFALAVNAVGYRLIFGPLGKLNRSLERLREGGEENIFGVGRNDELGHISDTLQDFFIKSYRDALTGICNRRYMESNFQHYMELLARVNGWLSVLMLDVDFFKKYNDTYGHEQGDACLRAVAQALVGSMRRTNDFAARYGGEEFAVVLPNTDEDGARLVADKLLERIRDLNIPHANSDVAPHITVSIGATTGKAAHMQKWEDYIACADEALYMSKQSGRDRVTFLEFLGKQDSGV
jgi:diguanylate cyclase (GGDEF)-like protein